MSNKMIGGYPANQLRVMAEMERRKLAREIETIREAQRKANARLTVLLERLEEVHNALDLLGFE